MSMPFYISPEQAMKDRADFARSGIHKGRSVAAVSCQEGICLIADNPSNTLHKISEIYDRIAFGAAGRYSEFESLRIAGIRHADLRGYSYDRRDVTARSLVNAYAQLLGGIFASVAEKPFEVELILAEVGASTAEDNLFRISYDGSIVDATDIAVVGGNAEELRQQIAAGYAPDKTVTQIIELVADAMGGVPREALEVAVLYRAGEGRRFTRLEA